MDWVRVLHGVIWFVIFSFILGLFIWKHHQKEECEASNGVFARELLSFQYECLPRVGRIND